MCTFKLGFSPVLYLPQAVHWFCYCTVISTREIVLFISNLPQPHLCCICNPFRYDLLVAVAGGGCRMLPLFLLSERSYH